MHRAALTPVCKQLMLPAGRALVRVSRRRLTTGPEPTVVPPAAKKNTARRLIFYTTLAAGTFYVGSAFVAFSNQRYYDFFVENVPFGSSVIQFAEEHDWDTTTTEDVMAKGESAVAYVQGLFTGASTSAKQAADKSKEKAGEAALNTKAAATTAVSKAQEAKEAGAAKAQALKEASVAKAQSTKDAVIGKAQSVKAAAAGVVAGSVERVKAAASKASTTVEKNQHKFKELGQQSAGAVQHQTSQFLGEIDELIARAEAAVSGKPYDAPATKSAPPSAGSTHPDAAPPASSEPAPSAPKSAGNVYDAPLPLGFEAPPGFSRPAAPKPAAHAPVKADAAPAPLPLVAPAVAELGASEPIIAQLASTIDHLASYLSANPTAAEKARDVLDTAKVDLTQLAGRVEEVKAQERRKLEAELDRQAHEYNLKLVEIEFEAQDRLDNQEDGFRKYLEEEKAKFVKAYREKLDRELQTQSEIINERLKEEVIAQGIELQRRWIREIKVRVEQERGGRLAKLDELAAGLKRLERVALDNSTYLDENLRVHALWSALRALTHAVDAPVRRPFREELRVLRHFAAAKEDPAAAAALATLEATDVPDVGVEPFADLAAWFAASVAPRVESVALVPDENAGLLSHLASHLFSSFRFKRQGLVQGSDVLSVIARAEYYLNEKDLDSATRELNQLKGTAKVLLSDWLDAARKRLEVLQALEVIQTQATLAALLVV